MEFRDVKDLTYAQATAELDEILQLMQSDKCEIDSLAAYTRRAAELLAECRGRLTLTDRELNQILSTLNPS